MKRSEPLEVDLCRKRPLTPKYGNLTSDPKSEKPEFNQLSMNGLRGYFFDEIEI